MSAPEVSVVIPTYRRETRLSFALDALAAQTLDPARFEVIVVRTRVDGGARTSAPEDLPVRFLDSPTPGAAAQRNHGWRAAAAPLVAFTDDDCRPSPDWLERLLDAYRGDDAILQGRTEADPEEKHLGYGVARSMWVVGPDQWYPTCNIAYPRALLERLDGFDEGFPAAWCEDTDLGLRANAMGVELAYVDDALVWHAVHVRPIGAALREAAQRDSLPLVLARYPEQRKRLHLRLFVSDRHAKWVLAAAGALLWRRSRLLGALAVYPYVWSAVEERLRDPNPLSPLGLFRVAGDLAARATVDGVEVGALARSSIRHGQPVL